MAGFLYKPIGQGQVGGGKANFLLENTNLVSGGFYTDDGELVERFNRFQGTPEGGAAPAVKFSASKPGGAYGQNLTARFTDSSGKVYEYKLPEGGQRYEGDLNDPESLQAVNKGPLGGGGAPGGFAPGQIGNFGFFPAFLGDQFPSPSLARYKNIETAPYSPTDVMDFAKAFGSFNREEVAKNYEQAKGFALDELQTELKGLEGFVPAASALKRRETALDNIFNQQQRTQQLNTALPGVIGDLEAQAERARAFASGRAPDEITDRALELGIRSQAADSAYAGGFGTGSSVARKVSDLMSAEQRIRLSQYGDQLLSGNINQKAAIELAPTEYSNAGEQIRVTPEVGAGRLTSQNLSELNQATLLSPANALSSTIQQNQFATSLEQQTRQFNAGNQLQKSIFNTGQRNQFKLDKFQYLVGYAGTVAGAAQTNTNTAVALQQQQQYGQIFQDNLDKTQAANQLSSILELAGVAGAGLYLGGAFKGSTNQPSDTASGGVGGQTNVDGTVSGNLTPSPIPNTNPTQPPFQTNPEGTPGNIVIPPGQDIPDGYTPVASDPSGGVQVVPDSGYQTPIDNFSSDTGIGVESLKQSPSVTRALLTAGSGTLNAAGVYQSPRPGTALLGMSDVGRPLYTSVAASQSNNAQAGKEQVSMLQKVLDPLGAFSREDATQIEKVATVAGDANLAATLLEQYQNGDKKGFINTILGRFQQPLIEKLTDDPKNQAGLNAAFSSYQLFSQWGKLSDAQKGLALAKIGIDGVKFADGTNLATKPIIKPGLDANGKIATPGLNVGQALDLFQAGYNTYSLVKHWNQLSTLQKIAAGTGDYVQLASLAKQFNLIGAGTSGAVVPGATASSLAAKGFTAAPHLGIGAGSIPKGAPIPEGYTGIGTSESGGTNIIPTPNLQSAAMDYLKKAGGAATFALGANQVYKGWGAGGTKGAINGTLGGSAMVAGLSQMGAGAVLGAAAPWVYGGIIAASILGNAVKTGKSADQGARDSVREYFQQNGLTDDDFNVTLADGNKFNIGVDGHGGYHQFAHPELRTEAHSKDGHLNAWDIDYTNDLDYAAGMGGITLSRLTTGGTGKAIDQVGSQLGNASLSTVGYGKDFSAQNFGAVQQNLRAMYAQNGIKSKTDGYQLANQAFAEGRINESDHAAALQSMDMIFNNDGYQTAQKLMAGRWRGIEVASTFEPAKTPFTVEGPSSIKIPDSIKVQARPLSLSKDDIRKLNQKRYGAQAPSQPMAA